MGELVTEAKIELFGPIMGWQAMTVGTIPGMSVPYAVERARFLWRYAEKHGRNETGPPTPVRVIDSAGVVVEQWGRP
jgi:hypothetical protein